MNWVLVSWIFVAILTAINVFVFIKLKNASQQMMKMAFPNAKNMGDAMSQMQNMMGGLGGGMGGKPGQGMPDMSALMGQMNNPKMQAQMKQAMDMLAQMQKNQKR